MVNLCEDTSWQVWAGPVDRGRAVAAQASHLVVSRVCHAGRVLDTATLRVFLALARAAWTIPVP